jgi:hypothetical protein
MGSAFGEYHSGFVGYPQYGRIGGISCLPVMNSPKPMPHKLLIRTGYVNFGHPSLPIYRNPCYFTPDLRPKIEILHTPIMQKGLSEQVV